MKNIIRAGIVAGLLVAGIAAYAHPAHPDISKAHDLVAQAMDLLDTAQKDNEGHLGGHAAKAKQYLAQAEDEIKQADQEN